MKNSDKQKVMFVYNADSGLRNALVDGAHKILSPSTYACNLCELTFGTFTERKIWKQFREASQYQMDFLHKDEFSKQYASKFGHKFTFPIVLAEGQNGLEVLIGTVELNGLKDTSDLIGLLEKRL